MLQVVLDRDIDFILQFYFEASLTEIPPINEFCEYDAFIASTPYNDKVFLHPWKRTKRNGDWFEARGYCAKN